MNSFEENYKKLFDDFGENKNMVLSTCSDDVVSSRMMSVIVIDGCFYFQTDKNFRKCSQIFKNPNVALCADNISVEGKCSEVGTPFENKEFIRLFEQHYNWSFNKYSALINERLFKVEPVYVQKWIYEDSQPYIESFDLKNKIYSKKLYNA